MTNSVRLCARKAYTTLGDTMVQVKVFDESHEDDLSEAVNHFLADHPDIELFDIKYATAIGVDKEDQLYCFSAMLIYRDKAA